MGSDSAACREDPVAAGGQDLRCERVHEGGFAARFVGEHPWADGQVMARIERGSGALSVERQVAALALLFGGVSQAEIARQFGVTKNTIAGIWRRYGEGRSRDPEPTTLFARCERLNAACDAVLRATAGIGRVPNEPKMVGHG